MNDRETISISTGNTKMGDIPSVSLPPIITCQEHVPCARDGRCYVIKHMKFGTVVRAFSKNYRIYLEDPQRYFSQIKGYLLFYEPEYFRYHVGGDIPDQEYFDRIKALCLEVPEVKFMLMTKCYMDKHYYEWRAEGEEGSPKKRSIELTCGVMPSNLSIIISAWPGYPIPADLRERFPIAYMDDGNEPRITAADFVCHNHCDSCHYCWAAKKTRKNVVFPLH